MSGPKPEPEEKHDVPGGAAPPAQSSPAHAAPPAQGPEGSERGSAPPERRGGSAPPERRGGSAPPERRGGSAPPERLRRVGTYVGPAHSAPYALSRMAPSFGLVDVAKEIELADSTIATMATGKLELIARQMRALREEAERVLERARCDAELHRMKCSFEKSAGGIYHLYRRASGELYFSLMAPNEWSLPHAQEHVGSYRLEADMSFTPLEEIERADGERAGLLNLLLPHKPQG